MSDLYLLQGQRDPDSLITEKRQHEYDLVASFCKDSYKIFSSSNKSEYSWEHGLVLKLLEYHPDIDHRILMFWKKAPIFKKLNPPWEVKLSPSAYNFIVSESKVLSSMHYLIDLMMGRFRLTAILGHYYFLTTPMYANEEKLFCVVVAEKYPEQTFKLIVGKIEDFDLKKSAKLAAREICGEVILLETFDKFTSEDTFIASEDGYKPGDYETALKSNSTLRAQDSELFEPKEEEKMQITVNKTEQDNKPNISAVKEDLKLVEEMGLELVLSIVNKILENSANDPKNFGRVDLSIQENEFNSIDKLESGENLAIVTKEKFENAKKELESVLLEGKLTTDELEKNKDINIYELSNPQDKNVRSEGGCLQHEETNLGKSKNEMNETVKDNQKSPACTELNIEHEKRHYVDKNLEFTPSEEFKMGIPEDLVKLKETIERNREKYMYYIKLKSQSLENWKDMIIHYWSLSAYTIDRFDFFLGFDIIWNISVDREVLEVFKNMREYEFMHYLNKILKFAQGYAIDDFDTFYNLYNKTNEDFLIVPMILENTNLMPIFSVLCVFKNNMTQQNNYQLKVINFYSIKTLNPEIEKFKRHQGFSKIFDFFAKPGIKSITLIEKNKKIFPIHPLTQLKKPTNKKSIIFLFKIPSNSKDFDFMLSPYSNNELKVEKELLEFKENTQKIHIIKIDTDLPLKSTYSLQLKKSWSLSTSYISGFLKTEPNKRIIMENEYQFLFNIEINPYASDYPHYQNTQKFHIDIYDQLLLYIKYFNLDAPFEKFECLIQSFGSLTKADLQMGSLEKQKMIVEYVDSHFIERIHENQIESLYLPLCILGMIEKFPSKDIKITNILEKILNTIANHSEKYIQTLKLKVNFNIAIIGLSKILALSRINNFTTEIIFNTIFDYNILGKITIQFLEILKDNNIEFSPEEINFYLKCLKNFNNERKNLALINLVGLIKNPEKKVDLLLDPTL